MILHITWHLSLLIKSENVKINGDTTVAIDKNKIYSGKM